MGVVYEAEQVSLGRRVALKVLPLAGTLDPRRLQRFHNEARAAACLHHTNIVPVYAVGQEQGVHFYAMQLIEGQTLAAVLAELRLQADGGGAGKDLAGGHGEATTAYPPPPGAAEAAGSTAPQAALSTAGGVTSKEYVRSVARLGAQAAEALDYAHQLGVVHRDVKPGNLMVDGRGQLWVADFGLAQFRQEGAESLTLTGDLVGTVRYMSPEQALAKRVVIDHRTDVYSLGATLYELLTLRPVFDGADRQELLRQIAFDEPRPPRRVNRALPQELDTVLLKALAKNPAERYATAQELADDLRRFLDDRPILARRPNLIQRARKWARRHKGLVRTAAALTFLVLVVGGALLWREHLQRAAVERAVEAALDRANLLQQQERWDEALAVLTLADSQLEGRGLEALREQVHRQRRDVDMLMQVEQARLQAAASGKDAGPDWAGADRLYTAAFVSYGLDVTSLDPAEAAGRVRASAIATDLIVGLDFWGSIRNASRRGSGAPLRVVANRADDDPWRQRYREAARQGDRVALDGLAKDERALGQSLANIVQLANALRKAQSWGVAEQLMRRAQQGHPADFWVNLELATILNEKLPPDHAQAVRFYQAALALRPRSATVWNNLAIALRAQGKLTEAEAAYRRAITLSPGFADAHHNLGFALRDLGKLGEAATAFRRAIELKRDDYESFNMLGNVLKAQGNLPEAVAAYRKAIELKHDCACAHSNLGGALLDRGKLAEADAACRHAIKLQPNSAQAHNNLGAVLKAQGKLPEAEAAFGRAIKHLPGYAKAHYNLGSALHAQGKLAPAEAAYRRAIALNPGLAVAYMDLGVALFKRKKLAEAEAACGRAIKLQPKLALAHHNLAAVLTVQGKLAEAEAAVRKALDLKPDCAEAHCGLAQVLRDTGQFEAALASLRRGHELGSKRPYWPHPSAQWVKQCEDLVRLDRQLSVILRGESQPVTGEQRLLLARFCQLHKKLYATAARWYAEAFEDRPRLVDDFQAGIRYDAACAAALAGCGQGHDARKLSDKERADLRRQALAWLRADLAAWQRLLETRPELAGALSQTLRHWLADPDFNGVRGREALARLPEPERRAWQALWQEVKVVYLRVAPPRVSMRPRPGRDSERQGKGDR
jgi:tetratricopeptide (TPR) repeat protein